MDMSRNSNKPNALQKLFVVELPKESQPEHLPEMAKAHGLVYIKGCTRHMVIGLGDLPEEIAALEGATFYQGETAYARLLQYITGLLSRSPGESQIVGQFRDAFQTRESRNPESLENYMKLYQWLAEDNRAVRTYVTADLQSAYYETVAQRIVPRNEGASVAVVVDLDAKGNLSDTTVNLLRQLGSHSHNKPAHIYITHPDDAALARVMPEIERMSARGTISPTVNSIRFEEMLHAKLHSQFNINTKQIYVCPACNRYPEAEKKLVKWQDEMAAFSKEMILLGGEKKERKVTGAWLGEHFNITLPDAILAAQKAKKIENETLKSEGKLACENCALSRDSDKRPLFRSLTQPREKYAHLSGIALSDGRAIE